MRPPQRRPRNWQLDLVRYQYPTCAGPDDEAQHPTRRKTEEIRGFVGKSDESLFSVTEGDRQRRGGIATAQRETPPTYRQQRTRDNNEEIYYTQLSRDLWKGGWN